MAPSVFHEAEYDIGMHKSASPARAEARRSAHADGIAAALDGSGGPAHHAYANAAFSGSAEYEVPNDAGEDIEL